MTNKYLFTSESVTEGHPDKICDQISDAILDEILRNDPAGRVACETVITTGLVLVMGEITTSSYVDISKIVRNTIKEIGYNNADYGFDCETCSVITSIDEQSLDIALGVNNSCESKQKNNLDTSLSKTGAGDQGMMFGYACNESDEYMPLPILYANKLTRRLSEVRKKGILKYLRPDGKSQVTVEYRNNLPTRIDTIVISTQHSDSVSYERLKKDIMRKVIDNIIPRSLVDKETKYYINPTGRFVIGGPKGDTGLTGRKIIVDTYGGVGRHGGGAFSGKDPTKVDRSASYAARYAAKNIVATGFARKCEIQLAYAIGVANPVSIMVNTFGTGRIPDDEITEVVKEHFDFRPESIINNMHLRSPIYKQTAAYGHFGRNDIDVPWEKLDMVKILQKGFLSMYPFRFQ